MDAITRREMLGLCTAAGLALVTYGCSQNSLSQASGSSDTGGGGSAEAAASVPAATYAAKNSYMQVAIDEAREGIYRRDGGPFGAVVVKDGDVVGRGHNRVLADNDPTCHGEVSAIRDAGESLGTYDLSGCVLYTTGEPCTMCLCASLWANIDKIYYGCTIADNAEIGFRDEKLDELFGGREKLGDYLECIDREACLELFDEYNGLDRTIY